MVVSVAKGYSTTKILTLFLLATILGLGSALTLHWKYGGEEPDFGQQDLEAFPLLYTDKNSYHIGEPIQMVVALLNNKSVKTELRGIEYNLIIYRLGQKNDDLAINFLEQKYTVKVHLEFSEPILLDPNSIYQIPIVHTWDQKDITLYQQVPAGTYILKVELFPYALTTTTSIVIEK